jgi:putative ABC transport system permease protein
MLRATLKSLLERKFRLLLTTLSIVLGVGFVSGTYVLTDTMNAAFDELFTEAATGSDLLVRSEAAFTDAGGGPGGGGGDDREPLPDTLVAQVAEIEGVATATGDVQGYAQLVDPDTGDSIGGFGPPTIGVNWNETTPGVVELREGETPTGPQDVAIDAATSRSYDLTVGTEVTILFQGPPREFTVVGIVGFGEADNLLGATLAIFDTATAQEVFDKEGLVDTISVVAADGADVDTVRANVQSVVPSGVEVVSTETVADEQSQALEEGLGFFQTALLVFAGVALFVGSFIIFNTFSIIVAQRTRELALLRALGASRRQVMVSVVVESVVVGIVASLIGVIVGIGIAIGLRALLSLFNIDLPTTGIQVQPRTIVVALVVGTIVTVIAAVVPARKAARVAPVEALREADPSATRERGFGRRLVSGLVVTAGGLGALAYGLFGSPPNAAWVVGAGAAATFIGVTMLSPLVAGPVASFVGRPLSRLGVAGGLGRRNATRNPRRTARTAAALMIGLGLVSMVAILSASLKTSFVATLERTLRADFTLNTTSLIPFSPAVEGLVADVGGVATVSPVRENSFRIDGTPDVLSAVDPATVDQVVELDVQTGSLAELGPGTVAVYEGTADDRGWTVGDVVPAEFASTGDNPLEIVAIFGDNSIVFNYVISISAHEELYQEQLDAMVLVKIEEGADPATSQAGIESAVEDFGSVQVLDQVSFREQRASLIDQILGLVTALLMMAIVIAVFGIVNTLSLSVYERTRELGLLRAVGMSRLQVKRMVRSESVIIAVFGALLGMAVGVVFGWALQQALEPEGVTELTIPVGSLVVYLVLAGLAGVIAAIGPARRAAKLDVLQAVSYE